MKNKAAHKSVIYLSIILCFFSTNIFASDKTVSETVENKSTIVTDNLRVILPPSVASSTSIYGIIKNTGSTPDSLISVSSNAGMVMLHKTDIKKGMAKMGHVDGFVLNAGKSLILKPMSYHLMMMKIDHEKIKKDAEITLFLEFKKAGKLEFKVPVVENN